MILRRSWPVAPEHARSNTIIQAIHGPQHFIAQGDRVVALGHYTAKTSAGGAFDSDFVMVFMLRNGKVTEFQEFLDSAALNAAFVAATVTA